MSFETSFILYSGRVIGKILSEIVFCGERLERMSQDLGEWFYEEEKIFSLFWFWAKLSKKQDKKVKYFCGHYFAKVWNSLVFAWCLHRIKLSYVNYLMLCSFEFHFKKKSIILPTILKKLIQKFNLEIIKFWPN